MDYFPIFLRLAGEPALVVGGGEVAARKIDLLLRARAKITVVSPELVPSLTQLAADGRIAHIAAEFHPDHLNGVRIAIAATDLRSVNAWVAHQAERRNIPVNVVDDRDLSRFIMPAIVDRSPVVVAVGSSGDAPVLTRRLREKLESFLPQRLGALATLAGKFRPTVKARIEEPVRGGVGSGRTSSTARSPRTFSRDASMLRVRRSEQRLSESVATVTANPSAPGEVVLVGAGPGDPGLLTLRALRALQNADVVLYDRLVSAGCARSRSS